MGRKYTIVIEPEMHDWFAHRAIDVKISISRLVTDAMEAYRRAHTPKKHITPAQSLTSGVAINDSKIPEAKPKPYRKTIYYPNTATLNDTPRAREISKAARKVISLLQRAKSTGVTAKEIDVFMIEENFNFQIRRDTLSYLRENELAKRRRDDWVHVDFYKAPNAKPMTSDRDPGVRG